MVGINPKKEEKFYGTGRRKESVARVYVYPRGKGIITINDFHSLEQYFGRPTARMIVKQPLVLTKMDNKVDIYVNVGGGGLSGQADAIKYGIAKALLEMDPLFRKTLKSNGLLTRDAREVERKKPGQSGARKRYQYSKR